MIRHPLVRFGLFAVAVVLWVFLLVPLGHSFVATSLLTAASFFGATATMLAVDHRGPAFIGLSFERGWLTQSLGGFAIGCASIAVAVAPIIFVAGVRASIPAGLRANGFQRSRFSSSPRWAKSFCFAAMDSSVWSRASARCRRSWRWRFSSVRRI